MPIPTEPPTGGNGRDDMDEVVAQANQIANTILLALRTVHEYISPRAEAHGIKLSARDRHAWAVSLSIALSQSKAYWKMPTTRVGIEKNKPSKPAAKELFSRQEQTVPFSDPAVLPALKELREILRRDSISEREIVALLRESAPRATRPPTSLDTAPCGSRRRRSVSALDILAVFESSVLDDLPTGLAATSLLDRIKAIESLVADIRAHYKELPA
jgi:hypothetical protein